MRKKIITMGMALSMMFMLSACGEHEHVFEGDWKVEKAATCTETGVSYRVCTGKNCEEKETKEIPSQGHNFKNGSCTECGEKE